MARKPRVIPYEKITISLPAEILENLKLLSEIVGSKRGGTISDLIAGLASAAIEENFEAISAYKAQRQALGKFAQGLSVNLKTLAQDSKEISLFAENPPADETTANDAIESGESPK